MQDVRDQLMNAGEYNYKVKFGGNTGENVIYKNYQYNQNVSMVYLHLHQLEMIQQIWFLLIKIYKMKRILKIIIKKNNKKN